MNHSYGLAIRTFLALSAGAAVLLVLFSLWLFAPGQMTGLFSSEAADISKNTDAPIDSLLQTNSDFKTGWNLVANGNYIEALGFLDKAVAKAKTPTEEAQTKFVIADTHRFASAYVDAAREYKEIAADQSYPTIFRAYAAAQVALVLAEFGKFEAHDEDSGRTLSPIAIEVFTSEPYISILKQYGSDHDLVISKMYDYANSFYPLAVSEMEGANWYTKQLHDYHTGVITLSSTTVDAYVKVLRDRIKLADADIAIRKDNQFEAEYIPKALIAKGFALEILWELGLGSKDDADSSYKQAIEFYSVKLPGTGGDLYARFEYAIFVANAYDSQRTKDIAELLKPFYIGNEAIPPSMNEVLLEHKGPSKTHNQQRIRNVLFTAAPWFKDYLLSIGWKESDLVPAK